MLRYLTIPVTPFQQNCSILWCDERLWPMGDDTVFIPGHGPESSFGRERRSNPYVAGG